MSAKEKKLLQITQKILAVRRLEVHAEQSAKRFFHGIYRWVLMLYFEASKNDLSIRAESLSYFSLFSLMPLLAGIFLALGLFSHFAPVDRDFQNWLQQTLQVIPEEERQTLFDFILRFRDYYSSQISAKSTAIAGTALGILVWIAAKVFFNLESLMNHIWQVKENRALLARARNFVICIFILPLVYAFALSLPNLVEHFGEKRVGVLISGVLPLLLQFFTLAFVFRYSPNTKVNFRSAFIGAFASSIGFWIGDFALSIYVSWIIFILGAEVSFLFQNDHVSKSLKSNQRPS